MNSFYRKSIAFWFILLILAILNAVIREATYKPLLTPFIGMWAHQLSSLTGIVLFFVAIYLFLKRVGTPYTNRELVAVGLMWIVMTLIFETWMNICIRHLSILDTIETYYFWKGETWIFVLLSLVISPLIADKIIHR